jgi:hypothetical protein
MFVWFVGICGTSEDINSMSVHHMWFDFLNVGREHDRSQAIVIYLNKMPNVLQTCSSTFL